MEEFVIYDNMIRPNEMVKEIIGEKGFGDVVVKRKFLKDIYNNSLKDIFASFQWNVLNTIYDTDEYIKKLKLVDENQQIKILHCFSNFIVVDKEELLLTYQKLPYINENIQLKCEDNVAAVMFTNLESYISFLENVVKYKSSEYALELLKCEKMNASGLRYIGEINSFIQCITGNFDSRYFNSLQGTEYRLRKTSTNKKKIESEYKYYHLLPENMQSWFVMPFDYKEDDKTASYAMERLHMTDIAIKWVHGSIGKEEFSQLMDMYFHFFNERSTKEISSQEYKKISQSLYVEKVKDRIDDLKRLKEYKKIENLLSNNQKLESIDKIYDWYIELKTKVEKRVAYKMESAIGHGDPCFANAMYNRSTRMLKFIDPKGALCEEELWTNPYYDIAKLSHSVCGRYDFFNNAMFDITINEEFDYLLTIPFDNSEYKEIFKEKVEENGYDYLSVRLYEASLFLSMLPLHIDYPHKVFGFVLNAVNVLKEIEENV